jgi:hypothetical protein
VIEIEIYTQTVTGKVHDKFSLNVKTRIRLVKVAHELHAALKLTRYGNE